MRQGISLLVNFQCRLSDGVCTPPCTIACINICAHVKDPVVHIRAWWIMETLKHPACTLSQLAFPGENNPNFPREKSQWRNSVVNFFLKRSSGAKDWLTPKEEIKINNGAPSLMTRCISCNKIRQLNHLNANQTTLIVHSQVSTAPHGG